jgi:hypothetical protein
MVYRLAGPAAVQFAPGAGCPLARVESALHRQKAAHSRSPSMLRVISPLLVPTPTPRGYGAARGILDRSPRAA